MNTEPMYHKIKISGGVHGEIQITLQCDAPDSAPCRRRPPDWRKRETWTIEESTESGHPCWAEEWIDAAGDTAQAALAPTVTVLQTSALDLLDRMIDPSAH